MHAGAFPLNYSWFKTVISSFEDIDLAMRWVQFQMWAMHGILINERSLNCQEAYFGSRNEGASEEKCIRKVELHIQSIELQNCFGIIKTI